MEYADRNGVTAAKMDRGVAQPD